MDENFESMELLKKIKQGSRDSFNQFYEMHQSFIFHIAFKFVGNKQEAEDICHDVFLEVFQNIKQYDAERGSVRAWLAVKTKSRSLDRLRKKRPLLVNKLEEIKVGQETGADVQVIQSLEKDVILKALEELPEKQRKAIYLSYFQGETHKEIASEMNRPLGSVKSFIRYGLNNLRKQKSILNWTESGGGGKQQ